MKRLFTAQKCASILYIVMTLVVFVYTLAFMTQYSDLVGLKMAQNKLIANFYDVGLQAFNRQMFAWALLAVAGIALIFFLEIRTRVPDLFALVVMTLCMGACCYGAYFAITNLQALSAYYAKLDFSYLVLEGGAADYQLKFATFQIGTGIYIAQLVVCVCFAAILIASHVKYKKRSKGGQA